MINVLCRVNELSEPNSSEVILIKSNDMNNEVVIIEINGKQWKANGKDLITAIENAMNNNRW